MKKLLLASVIAAAAIFPSSAFAGTFTGVVVGKDAGRIAIASKSGLVHTVRTRAHVGMGARVRVNGSALRVVGRAHQARIHGVVVRRIGGTTFLAAGRSLLAIRSGRRLASAGDSRLRSGAVVNANVLIANGQVVQQSMQVVGQAGKVTIQAQVTAVGVGTITVSVNGTPLTIALPAGIQLPASLVGQSITLTLNLAAAANADDEDEDEDEDNDEDDDRDDDHDHGDHSGPGRGGDDHDD
jgi:hypothetical protein